MACCACWTGWKKSRPAGIDCQTKSSLFTRRVPFDFFRKLTQRSVVEESLLVGGRALPLVLIRNSRARRYVLRLQPDGAARVTIPRGGSATAAREFAERNRNWLEQAQQRLATRPVRPASWLVGATILFRGEHQVIAIADEAGANAVKFGSERVNVADVRADLRPAIGKHLWRLAARELPPRVLAFAAQHQLVVRRVTVRNQSSRWGSCSRRGTISLNWRLIQTPPPVRDYIMLHELMHLREMNHSARFWRQVQIVCPEYEAAESWLKQNSALLR